MSTCQINMSTCQIIMSTCQIIRSICQILIWQADGSKGHKNALKPIYKTTSCDDFFPTWQVDICNWQINLKIWQVDIIIWQVMAEICHHTSGTSQHFWPESYSPAASKCTNIWVQLLNRIYCDHAFLVKKILQFSFVAL